MSVSDPGGREGVVQGPKLFVGMPDIGSLDYRDPGGACVRGCFRGRFPARAR